MELMLGGPAVFGRPRRSGGISGFWRSPEHHLWCASCARTYPNGVHRSVAGRKMCPYVDCEGNADDQALDWSFLKQQRPNYPITPWMAVKYPYEGRA
jgi:hypothetical protein